MKNMHAIRKLKYMCTTFMLIAILTLLNVPMAGGQSSPTISLTPTQTSGLMGEHIFLNIEVSGVTDLYVWQAYVTWDSSDLSFVAAYEGPFLKGNPSLEWESSPYDEDGTSTHVSMESVGTGDGSTKIFYLDHGYVKQDSDSVYLNGVITYGYSMDLPTGRITFGTAPGAGVGITANYTYFLLTVDDPFNARDKIYGAGWENTYASLNYSQIDGYFVIGNCSTPTDTSSTIQEVDLGIRYSAAASSLGDRYRIVYYVGTPTNPGTKIVLVDWTSNAASLESLVWTNVVDPQDGVWEWDDLWRSDAPERGLHFAVETDRVGGDSGTEFRLYEAWATIRHQPPTFSALISGAGYVSFGSTLIGDWDGISGSGDLGFLEFEVIGTTDTALSFHPTATYLEDSIGTNIGCTKVGSHFYPPIDEDVNADGTIDIFDLALVGIDYGHSGGEILNPRADVYPATPDGVINIYDLAAVARKYGYIYS